MFIPGFFFYLSLKGMLPISQDAYSLFYKIFLFLCMEYAGFLFLKRGIYGVHVKLGGNFIQINSARYLCDEIEGFCLINKGIWGMIVYKKAFRNQPLTERLTHKYGFMAAAAALTLILLSAFTPLLHHPKNYIKLIVFIAADIVLIFNAIVRWRNYPAYIIDVNEKEKPYLSAEISDFCTHWDIPLTKNSEGIKPPLF